MPRRYYRSRTRVIRPKKKWASNIKTVRIESSSSSSAVTVATLVQNSTSTSSPTPVIVKAGNFKVSVDVVCAFPVSTATIAQPTVFCYIIFIPEGVSVDNDTSVSNVVAAHPEWVLAWKQIDLDYVTSSTAYTGSKAVSFSSRLKRNLNSGDRIIIGFVRDVAVPSGTANTGVFGVVGQVQFWTCAN